MTAFMIRDAAGELAAIHERHDAHDGSKRFTWRRPDGTPGLNGTAIADLPLYGIHELGAGPYVIIVEGEKSRDALAAIGIPAVATVTGAASAPGRSPLSELTGRAVILWPDCDDPGREHMRRIAGTLERVGAGSVAWLDWPGAPHHGDAADFLAAGGTRDDVVALVEAAHQLPIMASRAERPLVVTPTISRGIDAAHLLAMDLPPLRMVVPDLLPDGTAVLASPPKVGKSCLVYQIAVEVALGGELLGRRVEPGAVLYLALEDGARRGQSRLRAALGGRTMPGGRLEVRWSAPAIGDGLEEELTTWLDAHPDAAVVAIDTLQRVRQRTNGKRGAYEVDVDDLGRLQALFRDRRVVLLIVHHSRKESGDDFLASVSGTYGITGSADSILVIKRKRMEAFGTIVATGRDIPEAEVAVRFDGMLWQSAPASLPAASFERAEVYRAIEEDGPIFPAAIAGRTGLGRTSVQNMVGKLVTAGAVARTTRGYTVTNVYISPDDSRDSLSNQSHRGHAREDEAPIDLHREAERIFGDDLEEPAELAVGWLQ